MIVFVLTTFTLIVAHVTNSKSGIHVHRYFVRNASLQYWLSCDNISVNCLNFAPPKRRFVPVTTGLQWTCHCCVCAQYCCKCRILPTVTMCVCVSMVTGPERHAATDESGDER